MMLEHTLKTLNRAMAHRKLLCGSRTRCLTSLLLFFLMALQAHAQFFVTIKDQAITILFYVGADKQVVIPSQILGLPVTEIGDSAFANQDLTSISLPPTLITLGSYAFLANNFRRVTIPASLRSLGDQAFASCPQLEEIYFEGDAPQVGLDVFPENQPPTSLYYFPETAG